MVSCLVFKERGVREREKEKGICIQVCVCVSRKWFSGVLR